MELFDWFKGFEKGIARLPKIKGRRSFLNAANNA